jgi:hypothetical protein
MRPRPSPISSRPEQLIAARLLVTLGGYNAARVVVDEAGQALGRGVDRFDDLGRPVKRVVVRS